MSNWIKWQLSELAAIDKSDIESSEIEIYGEDEHGNEGLCTVQITDIAKQALARINALEDEPTYDDACEAVHPGLFKLLAAINLGIDSICDDSSAEAAAIGSALSQIAGLLEPLRIFHDGESGELMCEANMENPLVRHLGPDETIEHGDLVTYVKDGLIWLREIQGPVIGSEVRRVCYDVYRPIKTK